MFHPAAIDKYSVGVPRSSGGGGETVIGRREDQCAAFDQRIRSETGEKGQLNDESSCRLVNVALDPGCSERLKQWLSVSLRIPAVPIGALSRNPAEESFAICDQQAGAVRRILGCSAAA